MGIIRILNAKNAYMTIKMVLLTIRRILFGSLIK